MQRQRRGRHWTGGELLRVEPLALELQLVGVAGVEVADGAGELKPFFVRPEHRGTGVADALVVALIEQADAQGVAVLRLETGDKQHAVLTFYRRHGFVEVPRFGPYVGSTTSVCMQRPTSRDA